MKNLDLKLFLALVGTALAATGCFSRREIIHERSGAPREVVVRTEAPPAAATREIIVVEAPPAPRVETMGVAPSADHVWVPGNWTRSGNQWIWSSGHWDLRPAAKSVYVPGHWERQGGGYVWREGYWK